MTKSPTPLNHELLRARLSNKRGRAFWRSLDELAGTPAGLSAFTEFLHREFPKEAAMWGQINRRGFLKLMAASLGMAGLAACVAQPPEKIVPYIQQPEDLVPGNPLYYATAFVLNGYALGVLAESHEGRPTKIEGNPDHPASLGATDIFSQAYILDLYDPDRSQTITSEGRIRTEEQFFSVLRAALGEQQSRSGSGLRILTETVTSPALAGQLGGVLERFPQAKWHAYEPVNRDNVYAGTTLAFGEPVEPRYRFDRAEVILSLGSDFLYSGPGRVRYTQDFSEKRKLDSTEPALSRLYAIESTPTVTSAKADERFLLLPSEMEIFTRALANALGLEVANASALPEGASEWIAAVARDLLDHPRTGLVLAGEEQAAQIHALAHWINDRLGNVGGTVEYTPPVVENPTIQIDSLHQLVADMNAGEVDTLLILGGNPVYDAPADLDFIGALNSVQLTIHLGLYESETAAACRWHIPQAHPLETWGDARAFDGTVTILQPLIEPLYGGKSPHELLAFLLNQQEQTAHDIVKGYWQQRHEGDDFEGFWRKSLHDGLVPDTLLPSQNATLQEDRLLSAFAEPPKAPDGTLETIFRPDPSIWDGRFANNGWLQELPKPMTKLTWDNAALLAKQTADQMGLASGDVVTLTLPGGNVRAPVWIMPGQVPGCVTLHLGYGRTRSGRVGTGAGFDAYTLRSSNSPWASSGLEIAKTNETYPLSVTQSHFNMEGRKLVRVATLDEFLEHPDFVHEGEIHEETSLYPEDEHPYDGYSWGMAIDLNACIGCNACVIACQAENNIPVVGKDQVGNSREMHWIRIDRYFEGSPDDPDTHFQPLTCMHCENAPCEVVCPVAATTHSAEGLNEMTYNRCVGTRYCSNNCPYKVRRFNFLQYSDQSTPVLKLLKNPDVTVRTLGVMEKCTYCVQRINAARIGAKKENRLIRDGEIQTACQQVCPAKAIVFGNIKDSESEVSRLRAQPHHYGLLTELNTRPRTTYLGKVKNPAKSEQ